MDTGDDPVGPAPAPLSAANLSHHTALHPAAPLRSVQRFLAHSVAIHADPPVSPADLLAPFAHVRTPPRFRTHPGVTAPPPPDVALVLHPADDPDTSAPPSKRARKPLLVQALRGRVAPANPTSRATSPKLHHRRRPEQGNKDDDDHDHAGSPSSSVLVARVERAPRRARVLANEAARPGRAPPEERKAVRGGKLRAEAQERGELDEVEERLGARRDRRRAKALIRKDPTLSVAAVGRAAAKRVRPTRHTLNSLADDRENQEVTDEIAAPSKRPRRTTKERASQKMIQNLGRPSNISAGRLTLKPKPQVGIFNKGRASARTRPSGKGLSHLAFSEQAFLHEGAPTVSASPRAPSSSSSSSSSSRRPTRDRTDHPPPARLSAPQPPRKRTYGSRPALRPSLSRQPSQPWAELGNRHEDATPAPTVGTEHGSASSSSSSSSDVGGTEDEGLRQQQQPTRRRTRGRFSHVEVPLRPASTPPPPSLFVPEEGTSLDALSAESLARRRRLRASRRTQDPNQDSKAAPAVTTEDAGTRPRSAPRPLAPSQEGNAPALTAAKTMMDRAGTDDELDRLLAETEAANAGIESAGGAAGQVDSARAERSDIPETRGEELGTVDVGAAAFEEVVPTRWRDEEVPVDDEMVAELVEREDEDLAASPGRFYNDGGSGDVGEPSFDREFATYASVHEPFVDPAYAWPGAFRPSRPSSSLGSSSSRVSTHPFDPSGRPRWRFLDCSPGPVAPTGERSLYADDAAFRSAMKAQWPRTRL